jgi:hypothetical protein
VRPVATAALGFLLCVLWFDLMFDVQARGHAGAELPLSVRDSIAGYYRRVVTGARPMNRLVAFAMLVALAALVAELVASDTNDVVAGVSLALAAAAIGLAAARTVRNAVRLGTQTDTDLRQSELARSILVDHLVCLSAISTALLLQLLAG